MAKQNLILIGGGGHCKSCINVIESLDNYNIVGILDLPELIGQKILDYEVIGNDDDYEKYKALNCVFVITVGQIKSSKIRVKIFEKLKEINAQMATIISPNAIVSKHASIGEGSVILHNAVINAGVAIGENCIINTGANIEHDVVIGNHSHISTNAVVNGDCTIGSNCFIGSNATISSQVEIGNNVIVGAGTVVHKNINEGKTVVGNPFRII